MKPIPLTALAILLATAAAPALGVAAPTASVPAPPAPADLSRYSAEIAAAQATLDAFMERFNARDLPGVEGTFNFPHIRFASGTVTRLMPGDMKPDVFTTGSFQGWDHSAWLRREVVQAGPDKVHVNTRFARYRKDGSLIAAFDSLYIVTRVNGHWGIQGRSSFAP